MRDNFPKLLLVVAVIGLAFCYGFISHRFELFPYNAIRSAHLAYTALVELVAEKPDQKNIDFWEKPGRSEPVYRTLAPSAGSELIFVLGNERTYAEKAESTAYLAWIADRSGKIIHAWRDPGEIWRPLQGREAIGNKWRSYPVGAHLFPNGDILVSYHGVGVYPSSMGLAKFDKDTNLLWKSSDYFHHWLSIGPDGEIYIPDLEFATSPLQVPDHDKSIVCDEIGFPYDSIAVLDKDGNKIREIDTLEALVNSDLAGLFSSNKEKPQAVETCDPMHLNDAQILPQHLADQYPAFEAGDLLVSFRTLNTIGVLDLETERFKWHFDGPSHHQHSPRFLGNSRILMFDNYGGRISRGTSRILEVNVESNSYRTVFPPNNADLPEIPFMSDTAGHIDVSNDGKRILVAWTHQGLIWEIDVASGERLWEFVNTHEVDGKPARISIYTALYVDSMLFAGNDGYLDLSN